MWSSPNTGSPGICPSFESIADPPSAFLPQISECSSTIDTNRRVLWINTKFRLVRATMLHELSCPEIKNWVQLSQGLKATLAIWLNLTINQTLEQTQLNPWGDSCLGSLPLNFLTILCRLLIPDERQLPWYSLIEQQLQLIYDVWRPAARQINSIHKWYRHQDRHWALQVPEWRQHALDH